MACFCSALPEKALLSRLPSGWRWFERSSPSTLRIPGSHVLVGTGTPSLDETVSLNRAVFELGVDAVVVLPPYYYRKAGENGLFEWYSQVIRLSVPAGSTIFVYHIPSMTGIQISLDLVARLMDSFPDRNFGIKDSTLDPQVAYSVGGAVWQGFAYFHRN